MLVLLDRASKKFRMRSRFFNASASPPVPNPIRKHLPPKESKKSKPKSKSTPRLKPNSLPPSSPPSPRPLTSALCTSQATAPVSVGGDKSNLITDEVLVSEEDERDCAICLSSPLNAPAKLACDHHFCFECIQQWSTFNNTCPMCKASFNEIISLTGMCVT